MSLDDFSAGRQPDTCSFIFIAAMQALKDAEYAIGIFHVKTDAVVGYSECPHVGREFVRSQVRAVNRDDWRNIVSMEFQRICDDILKQLPHLGLVGSDFRNVFDFDPAVGVFNEDLQIANNFPGDFRERDRCWWRGLSGDS